MPTRKLGINLVVIVAVAALFTGLWALYNRPVSAPDWPEQISGFSFSPFRVGQSPMTGVYPSDEQIRADLELLSRHTDNIRTYSVDGKLADIKHLAEEFGLRVTLGVWISNDLERNEREIAKAIELIEDGGVVPTTRTGVYYTVGTNGEIYKTARTGCTCKAGINGRYACYHRIAVEIVEATYQPAAYQLIRTPIALGLAA